MAAKIFRINYKSDFILTMNSDAGWAIPFCIKFWTSVPSSAYFVGFDGVKYVNCRVGDTPTQLLVMFDDHHLPIGKLKMQIAYHTTIEEFPGSVFDEVTNARDVIVTIDGTDYQVMLDFTGEDAPELEFDLPAYANEAERIQNELQRQQNEADRIAAELQREQATAAAVQGAENVNAQLNGTTLTVTNRQGVSTSVNTKGEQGAQGPVGPEGQQGEQGPKGEKGDTGATGPQGIQGPAGPQGQTGVSITDFVKTGETETDTLYDIEFSDDTTKPVAIPKGEKGDQGEQGPEGPQGPMGDVAVITPEQQAAFTMYSEPGQNTNGPMTQKSVTDALGNIAASDVSYNNADSSLALGNVQEALDITADIVFSEKTTLTFDSYLDVAIGGGVWMATTSGHTYRCHIIEVEAGEVYEIVGRTDTNNSIYAWLTSDTHVVGTTPSYVTGYEQSYTLDPGQTVKVAVPEGAEYMYIARVVNSKAKLPSSVSKLWFISSDVAMLKDSVYGVGYKDKEMYTVASNSTSVIKSTLDLSHNSYTKSMFVELRNARAFTIVANADNGTYYAFTSKTIEDGDMVGALLPTDHERHFIAANETAYIDNIPEGAVYLYVLLIAANHTSCSPQSIMIHTDVADGVEIADSKAENVGMVDGEATTYTANQSLVLQHYPARLGIIGSKCLWINNSLGQHHILIPAGNASEITVTSNDDNASYYAFLADDLFVSGVSPVMAIGETKRYDIAAGETSVLEVPESTQWIAFNASGADGINLLPSSVVVTAINSNYSPKKTSEIDTISENAAATKAILGDYEYTDGDMNLQIVKAGREHGASCYWWYPAIISTRTPYKRIYHAFCDENGSAGVACVNAFDKRSWKVILKNLKRDGEVDLHNILSVYRVPSGADEGKIVCAYSEGHNQTNWMHIRISKNPDDITEWNEHISVNLGALATYSQFHYVNGRYYIFSRTDSGATWGYLYSDDLIKWSDYHVLIEQDESVDRKYFYIWLKPIADEPKMLRFISYGHPIRHDTGIRCGVIDFETGNVYDYVDMETPLGTLSDRFSNAAFTTLIEHPNETTKGRQRMYDLAVTELDSLKIVYGRQKLGTQTDGNYFVYEVDYQTLHDAEVKTQAGTRTELCQTGLCFLDHSDTHAANGICFLDENTVFVSRSSQDYVGYDYMEIYKKTEGVWAFEKEVYKELKGAEFLRNGYPIASPDGKYVMWMRGLVSLDQFEDAKVDLILYDVENDVIF